MSIERVKVCPSCGEINRGWQEYCRKCASDLKDVPVSHAELAEDGLPKIVQEKPTRLAVLPVENHSKLNQKTKANTSEPPEIQDPETCWFCRKNPATRVNKITMNKITGGKREGALDYTYYQTCTAKVMVCEQCSRRRISDRISCIGWLVGFLGTLALLIPWAMNPYAYSDYFIVYTILPVLGVPALIRLIHWLRLPRGIRATNWSMHRHPTIKALIKEGWMAGDKPYSNNTPPAFIFLGVVILKPIFLVFQYGFDFLDDLRSGRHD